MLSPISFICTCFVHEDQDRKGKFGKCVNTLLSLNSNQMLMTPKLKSSAWAFPLNPRPVYRTVQVVFPFGCLLTCQIKLVPYWASILVPIHLHPCPAFLIAPPSWLMAISFLLLLKAEILVLALTMFAYIVFSWSITPVDSTFKIYKECHFLSSLLPLFRP